MGFDKTTYEAFLRSLAYVPNKNSLLTLGRQFLYAGNKLSDISSRYGYSIPIGCYTLEPELLYKELKFSCADSIDYSDYEKATIIHDMNKPIANTKRYSLVFDGGCSEHIYNIPQVYTNIHNFMEVGGVFVSVIPNNNFSGHGFYQFSPEFFMSTFSSRYGMELLELYLAENDTSYHKWVNVKHYGGSNGRNITHMTAGKQTYIIAIARRIEDVETDLITSPPQQNEYETQAWGK